MTNSENAENPNGGNDETPKYDFTIENVADFVDIILDRAGVRGRQAEMVRSAATALYNDSDGDLDTLVDLSIRWEAERLRRKSEAERLHRISADTQIPEIDRAGDVDEADECVEYVVEKLIIKNGITFVGGGEKTFKSWVTTAMAVCTAIGAPVFEVDELSTPADGAPVLVFTGEGGRALWLKRARHLLKDLAAGAGITLDQATKRFDENIFVSAFSGSLEGDQAQKAIKSHLEKHDPALVIIDPIYIYMTDTGSINAGNVFAMGSAYRAIQTLVGDRGLIMVAHFTKAGRAQLELSSITQAGAREVAASWILLEMVDYQGCDDQLGWWVERDCNVTALLGANVGNRVGPGGVCGIEVSLGTTKNKPLRFEGTTRIRMISGSDLAERKKQLGKDGVSWNDKQVWARKVLLLLNGLDRKSTNDEVKTVTGMSRDNTKAMLDLMEIRGYIKHPDGGRYGWEITEVGRTALLDTASILLDLGDG